MRHTTISAHHIGPYKVAAALWIVAAFWIVAGIVAVIALGGGLTRLAVALAIVTTEWWLFSEVEHRFEKRREVASRYQSSPGIDQSTRPEKDPSGIGLALHAQAA